MTPATDDQRMLAQAAREFLTERAGTEQLRAALDLPAGHDHAVWKQASDLGWTAMALPEDAGGLGSGLPDVTSVVEECGRALMPSPLTGTTAVVWLLARYASAELRGTALPALASGDRIAAWSLHGLDGSGRLVGAAAPSGLVLDGTRRHLPDGSVATDALLDVEGAGGPALAFVPLDGSGVARREEHTLDVTRRYATLTLAAVDVPHTALLPRQAVADLLRCGVVLQCAESTGVAARALDMTLEHVRARQQFGRPIGSFQALKHRIADMHVELEGARAATRDAAEAVEAGRADADFAVHTAKSWTGRAASMITSEAVQLHGGIGFTWEHDLHLLQRRAKANELVAGTPGWHEERLTRLLSTSTSVPTGAQP